MAQFKVISGPHRNVQTAAPRQQTARVASAEEIFKFHIINTRQTGLKVERGKPAEPIMMLASRATTTSMKFKFKPEASVVVIKVNITAPSQARHMLQIMFANQSVTPRENSMSWSRCWAPIWLDFARDGADMRLNRVAITAYRTPSYQKGKFHYCSPWKPKSKLSGQITMDAWYRTCTEYLKLKKKLL